MKHNYNIVFTFIFIVNILPLNSQTYSLNECIKIALEKNIDVSIQKLAIDNANLQHKQAKNNLLPSINIGTGLNYNVGYSISPLDYSYLAQNSLSGSVNISAQMVLFQGFQQLKNIQKTAIDINSNKYQIKIIENNTKLQVINYYLQAIMEWETLKILQKQYQQNNIIISKRREALENGLISNNTFKDQELQLVIDQANIDRQALQFENTIYKLKLFLQIPINSTFQIDTHFNSITIKKRNYIEYFDYKSFKNSPEVGLEYSKLESMIKQVEIYKSSLWPSLTFGYSLGSNFINTKKTYDFQTIKNPVIGFVNDSSLTFVRSVSNQNIAIAEHGVPVFSQLGDNKQHQFQLNFQWQIFNKGMKRTNIKLSEIASKQQEFRIKLTEQKLKENYLQAITNVNIAERKYLTNTTIQESQLERFLMAKEKFENNMIDLFEFSTYQTQLLNAELEQSRSKLEWYFNQEILSLYNF